MSVEPRVPAGPGSLIPTTRRNARGGTGATGAVGSCDEAPRPALRLWVAASTDHAAADTAEQFRYAAESSGTHAWPAAIEEAWEDARRGRLPQAIARTVRGTCTAAVRDDATSGQLWSVAAARLLLMAGRLGEARAAARCSLHMVDATADPDLAGFAALDVLARVALSTGDPAGLTDAALTVTRMCASPLPDVAAAGAWLELLLQDARSPEFADPAAPARTPHPPARPTTWFGAAPDVWEDARHARVLVRAGHRAAAEALLQGTADRLTGQPDRTDAAATHHAIAGVVRGDRRASLRAASLFERSGRPLAAAAALQDAAASPGRGGRARAVGLLVAALQRYDRAGATADVFRARAALRLLDVPGRRSGGARLCPLFG